MNMLVSFPLPDPALKGPNVRVETTVFTSTPNSETLGRGACANFVGIKLFNLATAVAFAVEIRLRR